MERSKGRSKSPWMLAALVVVLALGFLWVSRPESTSAKAEPGRRLYLTLPEGEEPDTQPIETSELYESQDNCVGFIDTHGAQIEIDGKTLPLIDALQNEDITPEEIFAFARIDQRNGFCTYGQETKNGLTQFTYSYPEFKIEVIYDIYETPDGKIHVVNDLMILPSNVSSGLPVFDMDREDWGLTFAVTDAQPDRLSISVTQSGGQQVGALKIINYAIRWIAGDEAMGVCSDADWQEIEIARDRVTEFTIDLEDNVKLKSGNYWLSFAVQDVYDPNQIHPLIRKYHDSQSYRIEVTVE